MGRQETCQDCDRRQAQRRQEVGKQIRRLQIEEHGSSGFCSGQGQGHSGHKADYQQEACFAQYQANDALLASTQGLRIPISLRRRSTM